jgi:hypothetical protein
MVKAGDLVKAQKERENIKYKTFKKVFNQIEKKIVLASSSNYYHIWYQIPIFIIGSPMYKIDECKECVVKNLKDNGFKITEYDGNLLYIYWN